MDAENLALREGACESVVALHLVDVLADPVSFLEAASAALVRRGTLLLSTPDPASRACPAGRPSCSTRWPPGRASR
jgi:hypothetical protein